MPCIPVITTCYILHVYQRTFKSESVGFYLTACVVSSAMLTVTYRVELTRSIKRLWHMQLLATETDNVYYGNTRCLWTS